MESRGIKDTAGEPRDSTAALVPDPAEVTKPDISELANFMRRARALVPSAVLGLFFFASVGFLYFARPFLMPVVLAFLLSFLLKPVVAALKRFRIPESIGGAIVLAAFLIGLGFLASQVTTPAIQWARSAPEDLRQAEKRFQRFLIPAKQITKAAESVEHIAKGATETPSSAAKVEVQASTFTGAMLEFTTHFVAGAVEMIVLLYFLLAAGDLFLKKVVRVLPTLRDKKKAVEITGELQSNISTFLFTITVINICLGAVVGTTLWFLGLPSPILWGVVAAFLNFIPYFGPLTGILIIGLAAAATFDSPGRILLAPTLYLTFHAIESNFITPFILGRRLTLNPVVIFISLIFWTWIWGIPGALLAVPMLMTLKILCDHFKPLASVGEFLSG
jgi:predicted PurR-regulated permease PerM